MASFPYNIPCRFIFLFSASLNGDPLPSGVLSSFNAPHCQKSLFFFPCLKLLTTRQRVPICSEVAPSNLSFRVPPPTVPASTFSRSFEVWHSGDWSYSHRRPSQNRFSPASAAPFIFFFLVRLLPPPNEKMSGRSPRSLFPFNIPESAAGHKAPDLSSSLPAMCRSVFNSGQNSSVPFSNNGSSILNPFPLHSFSVTGWQSHGHHLSFLF